MRLETFLTGSAERLGDKIALIAGNERLSYRRLDDLSDRLAAALDANGVGRGDRVLLFLDNGWPAAVAIFATLKLGGIVVPISPLTKSERLVYILEHCAPRIILTQARLAKTLQAAGGPEHAVILVDEAAEQLSGATLLSDALALDARPPHYSGIDTDLAMLLYTSGSSGAPKGVMISHGNADAASASVLSYLDGQQDDVILSVLPLSHGYGFYQLVMAVRSGATLVLERSFAFPQTIFETMRTEGVTALPLVPAMVATILARQDLQPNSFPALRYVTSAAAALPAAHIERLMQLLPGVRIYAMYGQTECKRGTYLPPERLLDKPGSVGIAIPNTEAFLVDDSGNRLGPGGAGEMVIRGPHVMQGYWRDADATADALRPGAHAWDKLLYTGDLFRTDADGYFYFVGRKDEIIKSRGEKVAPVAVEAVLVSCPGVEDAVVFGLPDPALGHAVHAIVVAADGVRAQDILRHCAPRLEDYMLPKSIIFRSELPRTASGKVSRRLAAASLETTE